MAEFNEVCKQWRRMCQSLEDAAAKDYRPCADLCPVGCNPVCGELCESTQEDIERFETAIMSWAAEHPEPVYPTWGEWLESEGICFSRLTNYEKVHGFTIPKVFEYQIDGKTAFICGDRVNSPIPADIAEKLGIEPKEG